MKSIGETICRETLAAEAFRSLRWLLLFLLGVLSGACSKDQMTASNSESPVSQPAATQPQPRGSEIIRLDAVAACRAGVTVGEARKVGATRVLRVEGRVAANGNRTVTAGSFTEGIVVEGHVFEGSFVKEGQVLARIHSHELHEVEAEYRQAQANLERRKAEHEYAQQAHARASRLYEIKAGSLQQLQQTETDLESAQSSVKIAEAAIESATVHLHYLGVKPSDIHKNWDSFSGAHRDDEGVRHLVQVRSPITGTVISRMVSKGDVVSLAETLYTISDLRRLWVMAQVPEEHLGLLQTGMGVEVAVRAYPDERFPGRIAWIANSLDPNTRTVQVRCEVANSDGRLKLEMYATLLIRTGDTNEAIVVPAEAVQDIDGRPSVFVRVSENTFEVRQVEIGQQLVDGTEIASGLEPGESVVIHGAFTLKSELMKGQTIEEH